ncbi:EF-hand domain-containing protein [Comamonas sp. UBA7528]|jgi:hypothetical protein|uniref:EF-hand domain-containing protein n=1 Tax=Comamonas sp. UBA7528 TaxID=1946391 RepID=UPI001B68A5D6|nr:EF-hand domain-containing protein [Comamonas sp. UBA7528]MBP7351615.1 EF-hand domain-containing protein [Comamonas sp.]
MPQSALSRRLLMPLVLCCAAAASLQPAWAEGQIDPVAMTGPDGKPLSKGEIKAIKDFQMLDFNKDGKISRKELMLVPKLYAGFDEADTNKDNYLSLEEVRVFAAKYRARRDAAKAAQAAATPQPAPEAAGNSPAATAK